MSKTTVAFLADSIEEARKIVAGNTDFVGPPEETVIVAITPNDWGNLTGLRVDKVIYAFTGERTPIKALLEDQVKEKINKGRRDIPTLTITKGEAL